MFQIIKLAIASLALSALVVGTPLLITIAHATETKTVELLEGGKLIIKDKNVFTLDAEGKEAPAKDGKHTAKDGVVIQTKAGKLVGDE